MSLSHVRPDVRQQIVFTAAILAGDSRDNTAVSNQTNQGRLPIRSKGAQMFVTGKSVTHEMDLDNNKPVQATVKKVVTTPLN